MTFILKKDGTIVEQTVYEVPIDVKAEEEKLAWMETSLLQDANDEKERKEKFAEIDALPLDEDTKTKVKDNQVYEVSSTPLNLAEEEEKLAWMKQCLEQDITVYAEYQAKIAEIDAAPLSEEIKNLAKNSIHVFPSGVSQSEMERQQERVDSIKLMVK